MKTLASLILICLGSVIFAQSRVEINLFNEAKFEVEKANYLDFLFKNIKADSVSKIIILSGRILEKSQNDSVLVDFLNRVKADIVCPYDFNAPPMNVNYNLLGSNVSSDSLDFILDTIVEVDSFKVGIFAIYTPDNMVKMGKPDHINFSYKLFDIAKATSMRLAEECDIVIMLSNVGKYIDTDIINGIPVDFVLSFDYQKKRNETFASGQKFYSIISKDAKYGKLVLEYQDGKIISDWQRIKIYAESN